MRASIASILFNLELPGAFKRKSLHHIKLLRQGSTISRLKDEDIKKGVGAARFDDFLTNPCFYINKKISISSNRVSDLSNEMLSLRGMVQSVLLSMWLVKDNGVTSDLSISKSDDNYIAFNSTTTMFSNSKGEYSSTAFSYDELDECFKWFQLLIPYILIQEDNAEVMNPFDNGSVLINSNKSLPYQNLNRLQRAIHFITIARSESFLLAKVTFSISALEALLSLSNTELRMQVADRAARIIGDSFEEKIKINKIVSIAYSFRSSYVHGSVNSEKTLRKTLKPYETVEELSTELDEVLRRLIKRFLTDLEHVAKMKDEDFALWINELLYS